MRRRGYSFNDFFKIIPCIAAVFVSAMVLNVVYNAQLVKKNLFNKAWMSIFIEKSEEVYHEDVKFRIMALDISDEVRFFSREEALSEALQNDEKLKDVLIPGENPFSAYFMIRPRSLKPDNIEKLKEDFQEINGVEAVVYDPAVFALLQEMSNFNKFNKIAVLIVFFILAANAAVKAGIELYYGKRSFYDYLVVSAWGAVIGFAGIMLYYFTAEKIIFTEAIVMPLEYLLYVWPIGVFAAVALKD